LRARFSFGGDDVIPAAGVAVNPPVYNWTQDAMSKAGCYTLVLALGDQLSLTLSSLRAANRESSVVLIAEVMEEAQYVPHHARKLAFIFSAMRHFATELEANGWRVDYTRLDDAGNSGSLAGELARAVERHRPKRVLVTHPGEHRVLEGLLVAREDLGAPLEILPDDRFVASIEEFAEWAQGRKQLRMEYFYREMRRKTQLLMEGDEPAGGAWNFDKENRKPPKAGLRAPSPLRVTPDATTQEVIDLVKRRFPNSFGEIEPFWFAVTREDARRAFMHFIEHALAQFGDYQDAMLDGEPFLYHSVTAQYLNCGLLDPLEACRAVEHAWRDGRAPLNAAEGFIRQIIGWREYVRGIYWLKMPAYARENFFDAQRPLPGFYWSGETKMACVRDAVRQTREHAYAHHIQRLMVTGNFALLAGISPHALHEWYLSVYADAYEWVELPNTLGMSQFADGGLLASKPYAASGAYISRMSNYCKSCAYDVKGRAQPNACPFNALYWDFLARNRAQLSNNPRLGQVWRVYDAFADDEKAAIASRAGALLADIDSL
jgi:deoxyribodipyrimidine photolyase-related protein